MAVVRVSYARRTRSGWRTERVRGWVQTCDLGSTAELAGRTTIEIGQVMAAAFLRRGFQSLAVEGERHPQETLAGVEVLDGLLPRLTRRPQTIEELVRSRVDASLPRTKEATGGV